jgi:hypothetical protein
MKKRKQLERPDHLIYLEEISTGNGDFLVGESVWIEGRRKSPSSDNLVARIVKNKNNGETYVNVFCYNRNKGQWHSFAPEKLMKRKARKRRTANGN